MILFRGPVLDARGISVKEGVFGAVRGTAHPFVRFPQWVVPLVVFGVDVRDCVTYYSLGAYSWSKRARLLGCVQDGNRAAVGYFRLFVDWFPDFNCCVGELGAGVGHVGAFWPFRQGNR